MAKVMRAAKSNNISKTTTLHVHQIFLYISLPSLHDCNEYDFHYTISEFQDSYFQAKAWCKIFLVKMSLNRMRIKNYFHINSFAISLALKQRLDKF